MKYKSLILISLLLCAFANFDIAPNPIEAKGIYASKTCEIRMESEIVKADLFNDYATIDCTFEMVNYGKETSIEVGFPVMYFHYWKHGGYYTESDKDKRNFKIVVDDKILDQQEIKVPIEIDSLYKEFMKELDNNKSKENTTFTTIRSVIDRKVREGKYPWYVWDVKFKEKERKIIKVSYRLPSGLAYRGKYRYFKYILNTGAGWFNDIGKADIILKIHKIDFDNIEEISPKGYSIDKKNKIVKWNFTNIEPTELDDIYLQYFKPKEKEDYINRRY